MKYLVNRETKEHKILTDNMVWAHGDWRMVEADDEGWIKWEAKSISQCPLPDDAKVEVLFSYDKKPTSNLLAGDWSWNDKMITHYRPILPAESKPEPLGYQAWDAATTYREGDKVMMPSGQVVTFGDITPGLIKKEFDSDTVFTRLSAAVAAADSIPALIAEINAMLPEGYEVREKASEAQEIKFPTYQDNEPAEDMSDWRNWRDGDLLQCVNSEGWEAFENGKIYTITREAMGGFYISFVYVSSSFIEDFKFHSRPVTK